jgi:hypothetical protein
MRDVRTQQWRDLIAGTFGDTDLTPDAKVRNFVWAKLIATNMS